MRSTTAPAPVTGIAKRFARPLIMGVVNCTPDSFHAASRADSADRAVERALKLAEEGADILDFGGQSTRPGSDSVPADVERSRVLPAIKAVAGKVPAKISIDTTRAAVAAEALDAGASIINDISALRGDKDMLRVALRAERVILMHMQGSSPKTMQSDPRYADCFSEVFSFLRERLDSFLAAGGREERAWIDPGIGFGKTLEHNLSLIRRAGELAALAPVVLGVSRKSMFGGIIPDGGTEDRLAGSLAVAAWASLSGVSVLRVHDVLETRRAIEALRRVAESA
ncbi:MAG: dihydropteroate synthase [Elusimicrobia bacterium]|nr:dihydropteroate synthase [Elusimicrobiota bacterium]